MANIQPYVSLQWSENTRKILVNLLQRNPKSRMTAQELLDALPPLTTKTQKYLNIMKKLTRAKVSVEVKIHIDPPQETPKTICNFLHNAWKYLIECFQDPSPNDDKLLL